MEIAVVIPSHKRAGRVITHRAVTGAVVCVPESQAAEYARAQPELVLVTHPDTVVGLPAKRNWIYDHFGDVLQLDDDISEMRRVYTGAKESIRVPPDVARAIIEETGRAARAAGAYLWGFATNPNPVTYSAFRPIRLTGYVTGCATGLLRGSKLWYNSAIKCNEDYWISLLNAYHHRLIWKDTRFTFSQHDTFTATGGLAEFRDVDAERQDFELLQRCFGSEVVRLKKDTVLAKRKHPFQKAIKLPF